MLALSPQLLQVPLDLRQLRLRQAPQPRRQPVYLPLDLAHPRRFAGGRGL